MRFAGRIDNCQNSPLPPIDFAFGRLSDRPLAGSLAYQYDGISYSLDTGARGITGGSERASGHYGCQYGQDHLFLLSEFSLFLPRPLWLLANLSSSSSLASDTGLLFHHACQS